MALLLRRHAIDRESQTRKALQGTTPKEWEQMTWDERKSGAACAPRAVWIGLRPFAAWRARATRRSSSSTCSERLQSNERHLRAHSRTEAWLGVPQVNGRSPSRLGGPQQSTVDSWAMSFVACARTRPGATRPSPRSHLANHLNEALWIPDLCFFQPLCGTRKMLLCCDQVVIVLQ